MQRKHAARIVVALIALASATGCNTNTEPLPTVPSPGAAAAPLPAPPEAAKANMKGVRKAAGPVGGLDGGVSR